jgi:predicted Zn-dependent protease
LRIFSLLVGLALSNFGAADSLPQLGTTTAGFTQQQEQILGQHWLRQLRGQTSMFEDPLILDYLNDNISHLRRPLSLGPLPVTTLVVNNPLLNAFAVPGNIIGVNSGLFLTVPIEEQFLSVLAHELAHLELHHFNQQLVNQAQNQKKAFMAVLTATVIAPYSINASQALFTAAIADSAVNQLAYTRTLEAEADRRATFIMAQGGYRTNAVSDMLQTMMAYNLPNRSQVPEYFLTHPLTSNRIADGLRFSQDQTLAQNPKIPNHLAFQLIRLRLAKTHKVGLLPPTDSETQALLHWANNLLQTDKHMNNGELDLAAQLLSTFPDTLQIESEWLLRQAELWHLKGNPDQALSQLLKMKQQTPNSIRLTLATAEQLKRMNRLPEAIQILRKQAQNNPNQPGLWFNVMQYSVLGQDEWTRFDAEMHYLWLTGQDDRVIHTLETALVSNQWTGTEKARIKDRLRQWRHELDVLEKL